MSETLTTRVADLEKQIAECRELAIAEMKKADELSAQLPVELVSTGDFGFMARQGDCSIRLMTYADVANYVERELKSLRAAIAELKNAFKRFDGMIPNSVLEREMAEKQREIFDNVFRSRQEQGK